MQSVLALSGHTLVVSKLFICFSKCEWYNCSLLLLVCWEMSRQGAALFRWHTNQVSLASVMSMRQGCVTQSCAAETHMLNENLSGFRWLQLASATASTCLKSLRAKRAYKTPLSRKQGGFSQIRKETEDIFIGTDPDSQGYLHHLCRPPQFSQKHLCCSSGCPHKQQSLHLVQ